MEHPLPTGAPRIVSAKRHVVDDRRVEIKFDRRVSPEEVRGIIAHLNDLRMRNGQWTK